MISHKHNCIFIHIPKTAGTSINSFFYPGVEFHYAKADYDRLFGWCSKRKFHMQHATAKQLLETELITEEQWKSYFKFTFVRNPWDKSYSDYLWIQNFSGVKGSFKNYINKKKEFATILNDNTTNKYLGDHLVPQTDFFEIDGKYSLDFIGRFENFDADILKVLDSLSITKPFNVFANKSKRRKDYSKFYTDSKKELVQRKYINDIELLEYSFDDNRNGLYFIKKFF